ncbi:hypothetical protein KIPB_007176, partial [Kipferlia bialata]|eukprot:g7176.t1
MVEVQRDQALADSAGSGVQEGLARERRAEALQWGDIEGSDLEESLGSEGEEEEGENLGRLTRKLIPAYQSGMGLYAEGKLDQACVALSAVVQGQKYVPAITTLAAVHRELGNLEECLKLQIIAANKAGRAPLRRLALWQEAMESALEVGNSHIVRLIARKSIAGLRSKGITAPFAVQQTMYNQFYPYTEAEQRREEARLAREKRARKAAKALRKKEKAERKARKRARKEAKKAGKVVEEEEEVVTVPEAVEEEESEEEAEREFPRDIMLQAPTGSGKTLAYLLVAARYLLRGPSAVGSTTYIYVIF